MLQRVIPLLHNCDTPTRGVNLTLQGASPAPLTEPCGAEHARHVAEKGLLCCLYSATIRGSVVAFGAISSDRNAVTRGFRV